MYENQRDQLGNQQFNLDQTSFALDSIKDAQTTVAAMQAASKTLKKEHKKLNLNDIENMQDEMEGIVSLVLTDINIMAINNDDYCCVVDMLEDAGEISEILGRSYGMPDGIEEEDLDAELACLEDEWAEEGVAEDSALSESTMTSAPPAMTTTTATTAGANPAYLSSLPAQPTQQPITNTNTTNNMATANTAAPNTAFSFI
jgi:charged multivesicular body protein 5